MNYLFPSFSSMIPSEDYYYSLHLSTILARLDNVFLMKRTPITMFKKRWSQSIYRQIYRDEIGYKHCSARCAFFFQFDPRIFEPTGYCFQVLLPRWIRCDEFEIENSFFSFSLLDWWMSGIKSISWSRIMRKANINICENENKRAEPVRNLASLKLFTIFLSSVI